MHFPQKKDSSWFAVARRSSGLAVLSVFTLSLLDGNPCLLPTDCLYENV